MEFEEYIFLTEKKELLYFLLVWCHLIFFRISTLIFKQSNCENTTGVFAVITLIKKHFWIRLFASEATKTEIRGGFVSGFAKNWDSRGFFFFFFFLVFFEAFHSGIVNFGPISFFCKIFGVRVWKLSDHPFVAYSKVPKKHLWLSDRHTKCL